MRPEDMMRAAEAGAVLRVHPRTVIRWAQTGKLTDEPTESGQHRFRRDEVLALAVRTMTVPDAVTVAIRAMISTCISLGLDRDQVRVLMDAWWPAKSADGKPQCSNRRVYVWHAERAYGGPSETLGIFSKPEKAAKVCQDEANAYFGECNTPALTWRGDDIHRSASYHHPGSGMRLFSVTRHAVDETY